MKKNYLVLNLIMLLHIIPSNAQVIEKPKQFDFSKFTPIVQVFGFANYDMEDQHYAYGIGRSHLGMTYQFNDSWRAKIILDGGRPTTISGIYVTDTSGNPLQVNYTYKEGSYYTMWLKFASLKWQVNKKLSIESGVLLQNHYITQEHFWGFRYIAQTFQDLYWHLPSTDLGFLVRYQVNSVFAMDAAITNGEGPGINQNLNGNVKYAAGLDINPGSQFQSRLYYHNRQTSMDSLATEQMFSLFAGYRIKDLFRFGGEFNYIKNLNHADGTNSHGFSLYTTYYLFKKTQIFLRFDRLYYRISAPYNTPATTDGNSIIGGFSYSPTSGVNLSLNYQGWNPDHAQTDPQHNLRFNMEFKF